MLNFFLQTEPQVENLIVPDSVQKARFAETVRYLADGEFLSNIWRQMADWLVWTGIKFNKLDYNTSLSTSKILSAGTFSAGDNTESNIIFVDHYKEKLINDKAEDKTTVTSDVLKNFITDYNNSDIFIEEKDESFYQIHNSSANFILVKEHSYIESPIKKLYFVKQGNDILIKLINADDILSDSFIAIKSFNIIKNYIVVYTADYIFVIQYI